MDPQACWTRIKETLRNNDREEAEYALQDLAEWIRKGGYLPNPDAEEK
jgi:hypothetical protein